MMLKEANELKFTAVVRFSRRQGMETEGIVDAVTTSQEPSIPEETATMPLATNHKSKSSGQDPATSVAIPTLHCQVLQFTPVERPCPRQDHSFPKGSGSSIRIGTDNIETP